MSGTFDAEWLALREPADHAARDRGAAVLLPALDSALDRALPAGRASTVLDLGCGTGSDVRWLAPRLSRPQHWVLVDHDAALLRRAVEALEERPAAVLSVTARAVGLADLAEADLAGVDLIATSALLDLLTPADLDHLVGVCVAARTPLLAALSVTGEVHLEPSEPLDQQLAAAFDAHQRRPTGESERLGPDAPTSAALAFDRVGWRVTTAETAWALGAGDAQLTTAWLDGWVRAAVEQEPGLSEQVGDYVGRRARQIAAGELVVGVGHRDLLAVPPVGPDRPAVAYGTLSGREQAAGG